MNTGIIKDPLYLEHICGEGHPENPECLVHIYSMLPSIDPQGIRYIEPRPSSNEELSRIHDMSYIRMIARTQGGYDPPGLARSVKAVITMMKGRPEFDYEKKRDPCRGIVDRVKDVKKELRPYWGSL